MFETIKNFIGGIWNKMFNKGTIESKMNVQVAMSNDVINWIDRCKQIHENKPPWVDNKTVFSMNTGSAIASEFARLVTLEFKSEISNNDFLNKEYQIVVDNLRNYTQFAAALGGAVLKPYLSNGHIEVDFVQADSFFPTSYNSRGEITGCIFIETKTQGDTTYTRLEYHNLINTDYTIMNKAFKKKTINNTDKTLGNEIALAEVEEWAELEPVGTIQNIEKPLFAYIKMPLANTIDTSSPLGISVFSPVADNGGLLEQVDKIYSDILWEYEAKQAAVFADLDMFKKDKDTKRDYLESTSNRLYKVLDIGDVQGTKKLETYSPDIRDTSLFNGLNQLLRKVEFNVGLAYGSLSDVTDVAKTATEIESSKQRSYQTVKDIQKAEQNALEQLIYAMSVWGMLGKLPVKPVNLDTDISYSWDDSIIVDKNADIAKIFSYVSAGILKPEYLLKKDLGFTDEDIKEYMPDTSTLINKSPFDATT